MSESAIKDVFNHYLPVITGDQRPKFCDPRLLMDREGSVEIYYAPFEYTNPAAKLALVGITPGPTQMNNANEEFRASALVGKPLGESMRAAKEAASFSGEPMRSNLTKQLNHWRFHDWLAIRDCSDLFSNARHLVHTTSLLRYPVFVNGAPYIGTPDMTKHPLLRKYLLEHFILELEIAKDAIFVALGPKVTGVFEYLVKQGVLRSDRLICGLFHPSGKNTYRINFLVSDRSGKVPYATKSGEYDLGRRQFQNKFLGLDFRTKEPRT